MGKTTNLTDNAYKAVIKKKIELLEKGKDMKIGAIIDEAILLGLDLMDDDTYEC